MKRNRNAASGRLIAELLLLLGVFLMLLTLLFTLSRHGTATPLEKVRPLSEGWYRLEDGEKLPLTLPAEVETDEDCLVLYNDSLTAADGSLTVTTRGAQYDLTVLFNDQVLYRYSDELFPRNDQMKSKLDCDARLPADTADGVLALRYENTAGGHFRLSPVYIGSSGAVTRQHYAGAAANFAIVFIMCILAVCALGVSLYLRRVRMRDPRFLHVASFLFICAVWCATDSSVAQTQSYLAPLTCVISFYAFMLLAVPMLHFVQNTGGLAKHRVLDLCILSFYLNALIQGILNALGLFDFIDMLFVTHLLLVASIIVAGTLLVREYRESKDKELFTILLAFAMLAVGGVSALLFYWLLEIPYYEVFFECGILVFVFLLLRGIITTMVKNVQFKTEMQIYQRLAREDRMTGLKNRRAFEEAMTELQSKADTYGNVALYFMDLNRLKYVNDHFGHNAGDELIIAAAQCIENAFGPSGSCFRIGGDEFCAVLTDPAEPAEFWFARLDEEIDRHNRSSSHLKLSIARGMSYLRDTDGTLKSFSDWKYQADQNMYANKKQARV